MAKKKKERLGTSKAEKKSKWEEQADKVNKFFTLEFDKKTNQYTSPYTKAIGKTDKYIDYYKQAKEKGMITPAQYDAAYSNLMRHPQIKLPGMRNTSLQKGYNIPKQVRISVSDAYLSTSNSARYNTDLDRIRKGTLGIIDKMNEGNTIAGMAPVPVLLRGPNYKNLAYLKPLEDYRDFDGTYLPKHGKTRASRSALLDSIKKITTPTKPDFINPVKALEKVYADSGLKVTKSGGVVPITPKSSNKQADFAVNLKYEVAKARGLDVSKADIEKASRSSAARLSKISTTRALNLSRQYKNNPNLGEANRIRLELGQYPIEVKTRRRRRGRYVTYYEGGSPESTINQYYKRKAITDWALANTDIKPKFDFRNEKLVNEKNQILSRAQTFTAYGRNPDPKKYEIQTPGTRISHERIFRGGSPGYYTSFKHVPITKFASKADYDRYMELQKHAGTSGMYNFYNQIFQEARKKKERFDKIAAPLEGNPNDLIYQYAAIPESDLKALEEYHSNLRDASAKLDVNIDLLTQGVEKLKVQTGKEPSKERQYLFSLDQTPKVESVLTTKLQPVTQNIQTTQKQLGDLNKTLSEKQELLDTRYKVGQNITSFMDWGLIPKKGSVELDEAISSIKQGIEKQKTVVEQKQKAMEAANPRFEGYVPWRQAEAMMDAYRRKKAEYGTEHGKLSQLQNTLELLETKGPQLYGDDMINQSFIADLGSTTIRGSKGGKGWGPKHGSTVLKIPKDKVPASGKVLIETTLSYDGYGRSPQADTTLGSVGKGSKKVRTLVPVDEEGNIKINASMTGNKFAHQSNVGLGNIRVFDPTKIYVFNEINQLTSQRDTLQQQLQQHSIQKKHLHEAMSFLEGVDPVFQTNQGKIAEVKDEKLEIYKPDVFKSYFGDVSPDVFVASSTIGKSLSQVESRRGSLEQKIANAKHGSPEAQSLQNEIKALKDAESFIMGDIRQLKVGDKTVATRSQTGKIKVEDPESLKVLGISLPEKYVEDPKQIANKIQRLETNIERKQNIADNLIGQMKALSREHVQGVSNATMSYYENAKKKGLIGPGEYKDAMEKIKEQKQLAIQKIEAGEYFPNVEELDQQRESDIEELKKQVNEALEEGVKNRAAAQAYQGVTKPKTPPGSVVGAVLRRGTTRFVPGPSRSSLGSRGR